MNRQFDIIVVGDSVDGNRLLTSIAGASKKIKIAFISRDFKSTTTRDFLNVEYIKDTVVFTDYKNRLFGCYLQSGIRHFCTHLIVATGLSYAPFYVGAKKVDGVLNTVNEIPKAVKSQAAIVVGSTETEARLALSVAKKYKYVYFCIPTMELGIKDATRKKLEAAENLLMLPNSVLLKVNKTDGSILEVTLSNYAKITCNAIFAVTTPTAETEFVSEKLFSKEPSGYLETSIELESTLVPKCYAVGTCVKKYTRKHIKVLTETILNDFIGGYYDQSRTKE